MITLLVVFFIILYAQSEINQTKFSELALSFRKAFNNGAMIGQDASGAVVGQGGRVGPIQISDVQYIQNTIGKDILAAGGYGPYQPVVPNDSREDRAKNRRVEIVVLNDVLSGLTAPSSGVVGPGAILTPIVPPLPPLVETPSPLRPKQP
jgi:hypothetical protein